MGTHMDNKELVAQHNISFTHNYSGGPNKLTCALINFQDFQPKVRVNILRIDIKV